MLHLNVFFRDVLTLHPYPDLLPGEVRIRDKTFGKRDAGRQHREGLLLFIEAGGPGVYHEAPGQSIRMETGTLEGGGDDKIPGIK